MGFDLVRAVQDSLGSGAPVRDRVLSYMYFADLVVVEQSTWDEHGSGVTIVGHKGPIEVPGVVLVSPLPVSRTVPGAGSAPGGVHVLDLARYVDLFARIHALSELDAGSLARGATLVAYRADPVAASLREVLGDRSSARAIVGFAPVGPGAVEVPEGLLIVSLILPVGVRRASRRPFLDVVSVVASAGEGRPDGFLADTLERLRALATAGAVEVLDLHPALGSDLVPPSLVAFDLGLLEPDVALPAGWSVAAHPTDIGTLGPWNAAIGAVTAVRARIGEAFPAVDVVCVEGPPDAITVVLAARLDPGLDVAAAEARFHQALEGVPVVDARVVHAACAPAGRDPPAAVPAASTRSLAGLGPSRLALGPALDAVRADPAGAARALAAAYLRTLRDLARLA